MTAYSSSYEGLSSILSFANKKETSKSTEGCLHFILYKANFKNAYMYHLYILS